MKNFSLFVTDSCSDRLFDYPCVNPNSNYLTDKKISLFGDNCEDVAAFFMAHHANVIINPSNKDTSFSQLGIVLPIGISEDTEQGYYRVLDYYVETLQLLIHKLAGTDEYTHIVVLLPPHSDEMDISFLRMAYYAVYGLVMGLGKLNAYKRVFINGIIPSENLAEDTLFRWVKFLLSDNSNNIVGQVIKL